MKLHFRKMGEGEPLIILHGLFGSSDNWQTLGKQFAEDYCVYLVDARNHGKSPHSDEFSYQIMAEDLLMLIRDEQITGCNLIGHSMGGKTVMTFAQQWEELVYKMIVADMGVKQNPSHHHQVLAALKAVDFNIQSSRKEVEAVVSSKVESPGVVQFLMKNVYWESREKLGWRMNVPLLTGSMSAILAATDASVCHTETLFLNGEKSDYVLESDHEHILECFPNATFDTIEGAGHWLHADKPETFLEKVRLYLDE